MRKTLMSLSIAGAVLAGPVAFSTPATAAPEATRTDQATSALRGVWANHSRYYTIQSCVSVGEYGRYRGTWTAFDCRNDGHLDMPFLLRVYYP
ncbi:hypothetical protein [Jidongwangia harbinensis]|uniref:hypothetical protein n=1 Tax=Jidongwangia harbinensis TaxID=2878561 RepID=UPI001CDA1FDB|nr:hypothetical protein [Jidongwangia harbinensis]MCA2215579.1 hypothetical protein [Jidongwangia harbinensis]